MMARSEERDEDRPARLKTRGLSVLLGLVAVCFIVNDLFAAKALRAWQPLRVLAMNLLVVGAIWCLLRLKPSRLRTVALSVLLGLVAWMGFGASAGILKVLVAAKSLSEPWPWLTLFILASNVLIFVCAIWSLLWIEPWKGWKDSGEPVSPATRRTNKLFGLSGLVAIVAVLALIYGTHQPSGVFSNSPISPGIAIFALTIWLLAMAMEWWWYFSADEHERKAADFASVVGRSLFTTVMPAWWVAARAGLLPQMDAMILWFVVQMISGIAWFWHRNR